MSDVMSHSFSHHPPRSKSCLGSIDSRDISPLRKVDRTLNGNAPNAYKTTHGEYNDRLRSNYAVSVQEMVRSRSKKNNEFGIEGY